MKRHRVDFARLWDGMDLRDEMLIPLPGRQQFLNYKNKLGEMIYSELCGGLGPLMFDQQDL